MTQAEPRNGTHPSIAPSRGAPATGDQKDAARIHLAIADWLRFHASTGSESKDWDAMATVIIGSISHYWLLRDIFETPPSDLDEERYITALVDLVVADLAETADPTDISPPEPVPTASLRKAKE